jgi:hypothetical protein
MAQRGATHRELEALLDSRERAQALVSGEARATLYEATLMAAYFKTSIFDFFDREH